ncbi:4-hydroxyphenylpyruvate dioxygenase [Acaryochloris sp. 'Moss Beach']|uniref:4-hydroxyphenylpyruvate dioxygenase n=1 Tax=Acaryochloris sp. 'Moss Beach' TaxID=2740837 RepID=UPI001F449523|nr:4-hydroxyphenylpyruvate dioxygenase [Acaryochloris sp. 'Moss Beach']UJB68771.1 4-hydroxyphenylpyruvate dioxygenase [Acaryochloris sp. 'Moss Beach']
MDFDHIHFYVHDSKQCQRWFTNVLGFQYLGGNTAPDRQVEVVSSGAIVCIFSSPLNQTGPVAQYLLQHPPGVVDLAFLVPNVQATLARAVQAGATLLQPLIEEKHDKGTVTWGKVRGWGALEHSLVERRGQTSILPSEFFPISMHKPHKPQAAARQSLFTQIDHGVLNVGQNQLEAAVTWYQRIFGFETHRYFDIQTHRSGLRSEVLTHPQGQIKFPINEPTSANSQIQEFLEVNRGAGIQHIALGTSNIVETVTQLKHRGLSILDIPPSYYQHLRHQFEQAYSHLDWSALEQQHILADFEEDSGAGILLQTFTKPIFPQPTFFFEIIERQRQAQGFGQRNFLALFQAMEREQQKRGIVL